MNNSFINQFSENIKFNYTCFDRVIIRGYILKFFSLACVVLFLRAMGFSRKSNGIMRIFTDQLNSHISKQAAKHDAHIFWWPSMDGGVNGAKQQFVHFKNPVISATFKTVPTKSSTQPYILEQGVSLINQGLSQITQGLAVNM